MTLKLYNTLTRQKEEFKPLNAPKVGMYVCGVTVYDHCHLGHARALVNFDVIYRYLKCKGYEVTYVRNYTDVDDKIINRANKDGVPWNEISETYIQSFNEDMEALSLEKPSIEPKATENIDEIIKITSKLIEKNYAYQSGKDVFFSVRKDEDYGKLSGKKIDELEVGARVDVQDSKKDPLDFALWKGSKPGEPAWESDFGEGRPGWHIECSAMSMKYLGESFDIHGGGRDLSFPHHENEIAQSESYSDKTFAKYWLHNGFININSEKMSKSLGNFLTIKDILKQYHYEIIRLFILSAHYRSPLDYTEQNIENAKQSLSRYYTTLQRIEDAKVHHNDLSDKEKALEAKLSSLSQSFEEAMDDDFNTAKVMGLVFDLIRDWNKLLDLQKEVAEGLKKSLKTQIQTVSKVLGVFSTSPQEFLNFDISHGVKELALSPEEIEAKLQKRIEARKNKDWATADAIRDELAESGIEIKDHPDGTTTWMVG